LRRRTAAVKMADDDNEISPRDNPRYRASYRHRNLKMENCEYCSQSGGRISTPGFSVSLYPTQCECWDNISI